MATNFANNNFLNRIIAVLIIQKDAPIECYSYIEKSDNLTIYIVMPIYVRQWIKNICKDTYWDSWSIHFILDEGLLIEQRVR